MWRGGLKIFSLGVILTSVPSHFHVTTPNFASRPGGVVIWLEAVGAVGHWFKSRGEGGLFSDMMRDFIDCGSRRGNIAQEACFRMNRRKRLTSGRMVTPCAC